MRKHLRVAESEVHDLQVMKQRREEDLAEAHEEIAALKSSTNPSAAPPVPYQPSDDEGPGGPEA